MIFRLLIPLIVLSLTSCGKPDKTTASGLDQSQVNELELRAASNDRTALRDLETHYGMEMMLPERERIHQKRLELDDPEALAWELDNKLSGMSNGDHCPIRVSRLQEAERLLARLVAQNVRTDQTRIDRLEKAKVSIRNDCT